MKRILVIICCALTVLVCSAQKFQTEIFNSNYRTLLVGIEGSDFSLPVISLNSDDRIEISFDEMSRNPQDLAYSIVHCNADWTKSDIDRMEYLEGFDGIDISDFEYARNTTFDYTHHTLTVPNDQLQLNVSGNYAVNVYDKSNPDSVLLCATFSVCEDLVPVEASVSPNTSRGVRTKYQQLNFNVKFSESKFSAVEDEVKILVKQNNRRDNEVWLTKPTYLKASDFVFQDEPRLVFEGGVEYDKIDFSHRVKYNGRIENIRFIRPYYHVTVLPTMFPEKNEYNHSYDENGRFKIWEQDVHSYFDIDYSLVHFTYKTDDPFLDGELYVSGDFNYGRLDSKNKMTYNFDAKEYRYDALLKNGGYNYQILLKRFDTPAGEMDRVVRSFWQTENEYTIYVYYRKLGSRFDKLVSVYTYNYNK